MLRNKNEKLVHVVLANKGIDRFKKKNNLIEYIIDQ